eukprot:Platyproteum_vivax@DN5437_c0_g1_i1.p1
MSTLASLPSSVSCLPAAVSGLPTITKEAVGSKMKEWRVWILNVLNWHVSSVNIRHWIHLYIEQITLLSKSFLTPSFFFKNFATLMGENLSGQLYPTRSMLESKKKPLFLTPHTLTIGALQIRLVATVWLTVLQRLPSAAIDRITDFLVDSIETDAKTMEATSLLRMLSHSNLLTVLHSHPHTWPTLAAHVVCAAAWQKISNGPNPLKFLYVSYVANQAVQATLSCMSPVSPPPVSAVSHMPTPQYRKLVVAARQEAHSV